jgi:hypothetical protein
LSRLKGKFAGTGPDSFAPIGLHKTDAASDWLLMKGLPESPDTKLIGLQDYRIRGASEKFKNQPRPLLRPRSVNFSQLLVSAVAGEFCLLLWSSLSCLLGFLKRTFIKLFGVIRLLILFNNIRFSFPAVLFGFYWFKCLFYFAYFFAYKGFVILIVT